MEQVDALINEANTATTLAGITVQQEKQSFITVSLFNDCLEKGRGMESPRELIKHVVVEHETTFLFGDTGLGKPSSPYRWRARWLSKANGCYTSTSNFRMYSWP